VFVMWRTDYHYRHEPILYGWKEGAAHFFGGGRMTRSGRSPVRGDRKPTQR